MPSSKKNPLHIVKRLKRPLETSKFASRISNECPSIEQDVPTQSLDIGHKFLNRDTQGFHSVVQFLPPPVYGDCTVIQEGIVVSLPGSEAIFHIGWRPAFQLYICQQGGRRQQ